MPYPYSNNDGNGLNTQYVPGYGEEKAWQDRNSDKRGGLVPGFLPDKPGNLPSILLHTPVAVLLCTACVTRRAEVGLMRPVSASNTATSKKVEARREGPVKPPLGWNDRSLSCRARPVLKLSKFKETGMVFVNHPTWTSPEPSFGGIKNSGYGRELSGLGILEFVNKKLVCAVPINAPA